MSNNCSSGLTGDTLLSNVGVPAVCCDGCVWPRPTTLYITDATGTSPLLNSGGGAWAGGTQVSFMGRLYDIGYQLHCDGSIILSYNRHPLVLFPNFTPCVSALVTGSRVTDDDGTLSDGLTDADEITIALPCTWPFTSASGSWHTTSSQCGSLVPIASDFTIHT